jgi:hypothetical protein
MITPPAGLRGTSANPITIKALNDGKVLIHGQNARAPVQLSQNDYFVLEGFNACCSDSHVVSLSGSVGAVDGSDYTIVRRVVAWDAAINGNSKPFQVAHSQGILLEDVAGFGTGRKIFEIFRSNKVTIRRAWGRWEGSTRSGPKYTFACKYRSYESTCENLIGTWSGEAQPASVSPDHLYAVFSGAGLEANDDPWQEPDRDYDAHLKVLGSIAYLEHSAQHVPPRGVFYTKNNGMEIKDVISYIGPGSPSHIKPFLLGPSGVTPVKGLTATNITSIGGATDQLSSDWKVTNHRDVATTSSAVNIFTDSTGARVCYRYVNGTLTTTPLWPWPMNQRILEATKAAGRSPVDVTATIERLFGAIPAQCKQSESPEPTIPSPRNLRVGQQ